MLKLFAALSSTLIHHYFDDPTKLFSDLYSTEFSNISTKPNRSFRANILIMNYRHLPIYYTYKNFIYYI